MGNKLKREYRELMLIAYEREIEKHLNKIYINFLEWKDDKICAGELSKIIHEYDTGPSKEMFFRYNNIIPEASVARGLALGLLNREELSDSAYEGIENQISFYKDNK